MVQKIKDALKKIADSLNEHWIWKTVILFLPSIYLPGIIKYAGEFFKLADSSGRLTNFGVGLTIALYSSVLVINILSNYKAKRDKAAEACKDKEYLAQIDKYKEKIESYVNLLGVYTRLLNVLGRVCDIKLEAIYNYIYTSMKKNVFRKPFNETVYPEKQLKSIAREMKECFTELTQVPMNNMSISMAYEFNDNKGNLQWIDPNEVSQCMKLSKMVLDDRTAFYQILKKQSEFLFYNDKNVAEKNGKYVFDNKDKKYRNVGSIVCDEISLVDNEEEIARIILTISTYGYKFTESEDEKVLNNIEKIIKEVILQQFDKRIKIELGLFYVKKQYNKNRVSKTR